MPNPSPMTYGVVATTARAVNALKGRPLEQSVAVSLHDAAEWRRVATVLDVAADTLARIEAMLALRLSLLVPLRADGGHPEWVTPAVHDGYLAMFDARWSPTAPLWDGYARLYGSSANRTGGPPASSAREAIDTFGGDTVVVDGDDLRDLGRHHAASTMVQVAPNGALRLYRSGAQDVSSGLEADDYVRRLTS